MGHDLGSIARSLRHTLMPDRFDHSMKVSETCRSLARRWGIDPEKAALAGLLHDYARDILPEEMLRLATERGILADEVETDSPVLLHGPVGALLVRERFGVEEEEMLTAIALHTTGSACMTTLAKILYVADYIEPGRDLPRIGEARLASESDLDLAVLISMQATLEYLLKQGYPIHQRSITAWNWFLRQRETKSGASSSERADTVREGYENGQDGNQMGRRYEDI